MSEIYEVELIEELPENIPLQKRGAITTKRAWYGHSFGDCVGRVYDDGEIKSFFTKDLENDTTELFDILRNQGKTKTKNVLTINRENGKDRCAVDHYIMRRVVGHGSTKKTVTDKCLDNCINVKYKYTYEILFVADDEYKRYVYGTVKTDGSGTYGLADIMESLKDTVYELIENEEHGFRMDDDSTIFVKFYNDFGEEIDAEFYSLRELMLCVNSVRIVELNRKIID